MASTNAAVHAWCLPAAVIHLLIDVLHDGSDETPLGIRGAIRAAAPDCSPCSVVGAAAPSERR